MVHIVLLLLFVDLLKNKTGIINAINFMAVYISFACFVIPFSLQLSQIFNITLISGIILLYKYDYFKKKNLFSYFFLIVGIVTSYFDLLTYPLLTLGANLVLLALLDKEIKPSTILSSIVMWFIGYGGMWATRWILSSIILQENLFGNVYDAIILRSSDKVGGIKVSLIDTLRANLKLISYKIVILLFIAMLIINVVYIYKNGEFNVNLKQGFNYLIIIILPLTWFLVIREHSYTHATLEFRTLIFVMWTALSASHNFIISKNNKDA